MLLQNGLNKNLWAEALRTATYTKNRLPSEALPTGMTPYEQFTGQKPNLSKLRTFGCWAWAVIPREGRRKLNERAEKCFFLGYETKGYRLLRCNSNEVIHSRDVYFNEKDIPCDSDVIHPSSSMDNSQDDVDAMPTVMKAAEPLEDVLSSEGDAKGGGDDRKVDEESDHDDHNIVTPGI